MHLFARITVVFTIVLMILVGCSDLASATTAKPPVDPTKCAVTVLNPQVKILYCEPGYIGVAKVISGSQVLIRWQDATNAKVKFTCRYQKTKDRKTLVSCKPA